MVRILLAVTTVFLVFISTTPLLAQQAQTGNQKDQEQEEAQEVRPEVEKALETLYPVPIQKGESINVPYDMPQEGELTFRVTDFQGEKHFGFSETFEPGDNKISFNTMGLDIGNYIVKIKADKLDKEKEMMLTVVK